MWGGEACAPIWRWRRGLLAVSGMSPTPRELRRVYPGVYPGLETEGRASLMRSRRALGPARAPFFGTLGAVFSPARGAPCEVFVGCTAQSFYGRLAVRKRKIIPNGQNLARLICS